METLEVSQSLREQIDGLASLLQQGKFQDPNLAPQLGMAASYYGDPRIWGQPNYFNRDGSPRVFMHPQAARELGDAGKAYLGPRGIVALADPGLGTVHVDSVLTEMSIGVGSNEFIGPSLFPRVQVDKISDIFFVFDKRKERRDAGIRLVRGLSAPAIRVGWDVTQDTYRLERRTAENEIDDLIRKNADAPMDVDRRGVEVVSAALDLRLEKEVAALAFTASNWTSGTTLSGTGQWQDPGSNILGNMSTARLAIWPLAGKKPNTLVMGIQVFEAIAQSTPLLDRIKYTGTTENPAAITSQMMASLFQVDRILVGSAVENTAAETLPDTQTLAFIWPKHALLTYVSPRPAREDPSAGYIFTMGRAVDRYREESITSDIIRANEEWSVKRTFAGSGYMWTNAVA